ncbi:MAG: hypothetical protein ACI8PB_001566 [Desulforhopalus sp.]|jgi:hypothetical protein
MFADSKDANNMTHEENSKFIVDLFQRTTMHHALWYTEVRHQMGEEKALEMLSNASRKSWEIQMKHLSELLGFSMVNGVPSPLLDMDGEKLNELKTRMAKNWLVGDGVWFQTIERAKGMNEAKRCNDSCWAHFSPFEAHSIKQLLDLPAQSGLEGLKRALGFRVYACINTQSVVEETDDSFVFQMNKCRVQDARKRKGLDDYPCKSAGLVEYSYFASAIDNRIKTDCIGCPPDSHPDDWYCAWKFSMKGSDE